jgi:hypothetical protein
MGALIFGTTKVVTKLQEEHGGRELLLHTFVEAYEELRRAVPGGDLTIHLYVEAKSAESVGAVLEPLEEKP